MLPKIYEQLCLKTESKEFVPIYSRIDDRMIRLLHGGLGLSSELAELVNALDSEDKIDWVNVAEESNDLSWYCAIIVNALGFDHDEISRFESDLNNDWHLVKGGLHSLRHALDAATFSVGDYNDLLKKHLFYGRELNMEKLKQSLQKICMAISGICFVSGTTIAQGRATNIAKLAARYPDKFTEASALNRDLDAERKILEDGLKT